MRRRRILLWALGLAVLGGSLRAKDAEEERIKWLWSRVICDCPEENWTRTLANCPNTCSNRQKDAVRRWVEEGLSNEAIFERVTATFGPKALAVPSARGTNLLLYALPPALLVLAAAIVILTLARRTRRSGAPGEERAEASQEVLGELGDEIERELKEMD